MNGFYFTSKEFIDVVSRFILSVVLLLSGFSKLFYLQGFSIEVSQYSEFYISSLLTPWGSQIAITVCCFEILLGLLLFVPKILLLSTLTTLVLMTFFIYLTGVNYLSPTLLGSIESCGCFGELIHFSAKGSFIKTIVLWIIAFITFVSNIKNNRPYCIKGE